MDRITRTLFLNNLVIPLHPFLRFEYLLLNIVFYKLFASKQILIDIMGMSNAFV